MLYFFMEILGLFLRKTMALFFILDKHIQQTGQVVE